MFRRCLFLASLGLSVRAQSDGNPHGWDRTRRCDHTDFDPPCGVCEGIGGIPFGDKNEEITLTSCEPISNASDIDPATLVKPVWATSWTADIYYEVLIGPKSDPFCFSVIPGNSSEGDLCYRPDFGQQYYDMKEAEALRYDLNMKTVVGNITSTIVHQGKNFWIINKFPWYAAGTHQCVCTEVHQGGDKTQPAMYPIEYDWTEQLFFVGREKIGIEYTGLELEMDHWAFGPHHVWSLPNNGSLLRAWQPFNGLQIFPSGTNPSPVDPELFADIPPTLCKSGWPLSGGAAFRVNCDDAGYYTNETSKSPTLEKDAKRAEQVVPGDNYKGETFENMSAVLNEWLALDEIKTRPCDDFNVTELRQLQAMLFLARDARFDDIYRSAEDNRRMRKSMEQLEQDWQALDKAAALHEPGHPVHAMHRDGHCHEAVMWYVHHLTSDIKKVLAMSGVEIPLLSHTRHSCPKNASKGHLAVCQNYEEQVTCSSCHSNNLPSNAQATTAKNDAAAAEDEIIKDDMCCQGECQGDMNKYYSIDTRHNMCGECCMLDSDYRKYKLFEPGLTKANSSTPCPDLSFPNYDSTVTHGAGSIKMTLDLYDPATPDSTTTA